MKKKTMISYLALLVMMVLPTGAHAQESSEAVLCMVLTQKDGTVSKFALRESPVVTYESNNVVVNCGDQQLSTEMEGIADIKFEESVIDGIAPIRDREPQAVFSFGKASFSSLKAGSVIRVYTIDGKVLLSIRANGDGEAQVDLGDLPRGIYIVRTPAQSYKIKK